MTIIERVAKAIYEKRNGVGCVPWLRRARAHKAPYLADARAAIEAMREPTPAMMDAINENAGTIAPEYAWYDGIDAALAEVAE